LWQLRVSFISSSPLPRPPRPTLFPYTTLFRSTARRRSAWRRTCRRQQQTTFGARGAASRWRGRQTGKTDSFCASEISGARQEPRSEEHTSELQSRENLVCRLLLEKKKKQNQTL